MLRRIVGPKRRPDDWSTPHERALVRLSDRLDGPLDPDEALWLEQHLVDCADCSAAAIAYAEDRDLLRSLPPPEPPRDLRARTMAAIEAEERRHGSSRGRGVAARRLAPYGALGSLLVVALVVGATAFAPITNVAVDVEESPMTAVQPSRAPSAPSSPGVPAVSPSPAPATPIVVADVAPVRWARPADDGSYAVNLASLAEVCTPESAPDCAPIDAAASAVATLETEPAVMVAAPGGGELVVADAATRTTGGSVFAFALATPTPSIEPSPEPVATPSPSLAPTAPPTTVPTASPSAAPSPSPSAASPTAPSSAPSASPSTFASVEPSHLASPSPSAAIARLAIIDGVVLVGETAAYSPSGTWFGFTARPADGSRGPDVYVWRQGWEAAQQLTSDASSVFSGWLGESAVLSRIVSDPDPSPSAAAAGVVPSVDGQPVPTADPSASSPTTSATTESVAIDPQTGDERRLAGGSVWRPTIDPTGSFAIYWEGTVIDKDGTSDWRPAEGRLVVARFDAAAEPVLSEPIALAEGPVVDWDVRWDEHGGRLALWIADPATSGLGELSAFAVDPSTGIDLSQPLLRDVLALPGISIGEGRLAWATPPGQGGEGSRLQVLAWSGPDAGTVSSEPGVGDAPVIVVR
jgi:hypothetical protein